MNSRGTVRKIASVLLGALLFAQAALAVAGCEWLRRSPAEAIGQHATPPCHQSEMPAADNLCVAHCVGEFQSLDKPSVKLPALGDAPVLVVLAPVSPGAFTACNLSIPACVSAPPPRILFSRLLI